jgi:DNA-directed RNA polymerase specialized sigma24 family protein
MSVSEPVWPSSPLSAAATAFAALTCDPDPLSLDLDPVVAAYPGAGLPCGVWPLPQLSAWLADHRDAYDARDIVWRELIRRARDHGREWLIAAVGMAMPALVRYAAELAVMYRGDRDDIDAEILTGFLTALRRVDLHRAAPHAALCMAGWRAGHDLVVQAREYLPVDDVEQVTGPRTPRVPYGHPDLLVQRATRIGVVDEVDEQPYIEVRLGGRPIEPIADRLGISVDALRMRLGRIDTRLTTALALGALSDSVSPAAARAMMAAADRRAAIRAGRTTEPTPAGALPAAA